MTGSELIARIIVALSSIGTGLLFFLILAGVFEDTRGGRMKPKPKPKPY